MKKTKKLAAFMLAVTSCFAIGASYSAPANTAAAYQQIASMRDVTTRKSTIAIGESVPLKIEWSNGALPEVTYTSSDESIVTVDENGVFTGVSEGTAVITAALTKTSSSIEVTVSKDVIPSTIYNTSELKGYDIKMNATDVICYDGSGNMNIAAVSDDGELKYSNIFKKGDEYIVERDSVMVAAQYGYTYLAPESDSVNYVDCREAEVGDIIGSSSVLLCYDYYLNEIISPIISHSLYEKYFGEKLLQITEVDHKNKKVKAELIEPVAGDVNADGSFGMADAVTLQKWLLGVPDVKLYNWKSADLCEDGVIDVYDLCMMKRELINAPVSMEEATLVVETYYDGYGVAGQHLGSGGFMDSFEIKEGDILYENYNGQWSAENDEKLKGKTQVCKVLSITPENVSVLVTDLETGMKAEKTRSYGETIDVPSSFIMFDGINYSHKITFEQGVSLEYDKYEKMPYIKDNTDSITFSERKNVWENLAYQYPDTDFSDFVLVYTPDHPLEGYLGDNVFSVYYKGILCHGWGNLNTDSNVFVTSCQINFVMKPERYSEADTEAKCLSLEELAECVEFSFERSDVTKVIYIRERNDAPVLAYRILGNDCEYIIDAVTGEEIEWIPYFVP